jgi:polyisoprenoid-binding protein YceI
MKTILIILGVMVVGGVGWYAIQTKPDASVPEAIVSDVNSLTEESKVNVDDKVQVESQKEIDNTKVKISFKGFGPGKVHDGSFSKIDSKLVFEGAGLKGEVVVDMSSLTTDNQEKLTPHLKSKDFFDVTKYPTAKFTVTEDLTSSTCSGDNVRCKAPYMYGTFTIHGVTKLVSFPVVKTDTEYKATFNIDMKEFGINQTFANEIIELNVVVPFK